MARIAGVNLPNGKRLEIGLTYIYGIGQPSAQAICAALGLSPREIFESLAVTDVQAACDAFAPVYERTQGADGLVSLEVDPALARDTAGTITEARRL